MKYVSIDIETTGLNPDACQILEFGAVIDDLSNPKPLNELPSFHCYIDHMQFNMIRGEPYALSMHSEIFKRIAERDRDRYKFCTQDALGENFRNFVEYNKAYMPITVAGKNFSGFDLRFLRRLPNWENLIKIHHRVIDPAILFWDEADQKLPDTKECKVRAGIAGEVAHTAIADCLDVIQLVRYGLRTDNAADNC